VTRLTDRDPAPEKQQADSRRVFLTVLPSIMLPMFLAVMDQTIVATALPAIAGELGSAQRVSWIVVSYLVATTVAAPVYGRLGDSFGRRRLMFIALLVFMAASVLCAVAGSIEALTAARILQGLGGGGLMTLSQALIGEAIPPRERGRFQGYLAAVVVGSSTFGPVAGGFLTEHLGWRSVFLVNIPLGLVALLLTFRLRARAGLGQQGRFDTVGLVLLVAFIAPLLLALEQVQRLDPATFPTVLLMATGSLASLVLLVWREKRASFPLLPIGLLRQPTVWRTDALAACHGAALVSLTAFTPIYLRVVHGASAAESGLLLLPVTIGIGTGSVITGRLVSRTGFTAVFPSYGLIVAVAALLFLAFAAPYLSRAELGAVLSVAALFMGTVMGVVQITIQSAAGPTNLGAAAASVQLSRSIGAAVGTAIVGAVLFASLAISGVDTSGTVGALMQQGPDALAMLSGPDRAIIEEAVAGAFRSAFLTVAAFAAGGALLAWSIPTRRI
jgi:EmrB/QacA subfamily drug resistance transporter